MLRTLSLLLLLGLVAFQPSVEDSLERGFREPPLEARPIGLWDWTNGNFSLSQITRELEEAKAKGMGGFDIWDVGTFVDEGNVVPAGPAFMSDESVQAIGHAVREADRLRLRLGLIISSSWNAGGSWVQPEHGAMGLYRTSTVLNGPQAFAGQLPFPKLPETHGRQKLLIEKRADGQPSFQQPVAVLAVPLGKPSVGTGEVIDLSARTDASGNLTWQVPAGAWRVIRYLCLPTGQPLMVPSPNSVGRMIDHFSAGAMESHLNFFFQKLEAELGSLKNRSLKYLYTDSYEVNTAVYTPGLLDTFRQRLGYDPLPYLPTFDSLTVGSTDLSQRFLFDYRKLLSDLIIENHYAKGVEICRQHGLGFVAEAGGPGPPVHNVPFEDLKALGSLTFPRGEFWNRNGQPVNALQIVKGIASAAHLYNQRYVEAEAFTSVQVWREGPTELKPLADRAFCEGLNRIVYHTFPHTPPEAGLPGWVYNFGTLIHLNNAWWPKSASWHRYLGRSSFLLQQGEFVGDVAFYYGDQAPNFVKPKQMPPELGFGYDYDVVNTEGILRFMQVKNGKITLPQGQTYEVLVLPPDERVNLAVLRKLEVMVRAGATVVGRKPSRSYGLRNQEAEEREIRQLADRLWGRCDSVNVQENRYGAGRIVWGKPLRRVLTERGVGPDVQMTASLDSAQVDFIHRRTGGEEIYFVRNTRNAAYEATLTFRTAGKSGASERPQLWNPADGSLAALPVEKTTAQTTSVRLRLDPHDAFFVVFRKNSKPLPLSVKALTTQPVSELTGPWELRFPHGWGAPASTRWNRLQDWTADSSAGIRHFSGVAAYHHAFDIAAPVATPSQRRWIDLGAVREVADVWLNGRHLGERCAPPYRYEITGLLKPGRNYLVVEVANVLNNRMVGDAKRPAEYRQTKSNLLKGITPWSTPWAQVPLLPSGLLGPVVIESTTQYKKGSR